MTKEKIDLFKKILAFCDLGAMCAAHAQIVTEFNPMKVAVARVLDKDAH